MPGANYLGSAYSTLSGLLGTPMAGPYSAGFDQLSGDYAAARDQGEASIARRGLTQSGAPAELFTDLGAGYAKGAGSVVSAGQQQQNQQLQQVLNSLLGLGGAAEGRARADTSQTLSDVGAGAEALTGLFGYNAPTLFSRGGQGLLNNMLWGGGNPAALLSKWLGI